MWMLCPSSEKREIMSSIYLVKPIKAIMQLSTDLSCLGFLKWWVPLSNELLICKFIIICDPKEWLDLYTHTMRETFFHTSLIITLPQKIRWLSTLMKPVNHMIQCI